MGGVSVEYLPGTWRTLSLHKNVTVYAKVVTHTHTSKKQRFNHRLERNFIILKNPPIIDKNYH